MHNVIFSLGLLLLACGCTAEQSPPQQGPDGSWWLGGADGGVFIKIEDNENKNDSIYEGKIYFDSDHSIWYQGPLKYIGNDEFFPEKNELYEAWDGGRLHLKNGSYLQAVNPTPKL